MDKQTAWDQRLRISTAGWDDRNADAYRYPYEPTPYCVLQRLVHSGLIGEQDVVLDYGCGKGRVGFFLSHETNAKSIGVEYDAGIYDAAEENRKTAVSREKTSFVNLRAEEYTVPEHVSRCYFFNPFSEEILHKVIGRILASYYENPREILLFFYYPSDEYISCLMAQAELEFYDEIDCSDLFRENKKRERIVIFSLPGLSMADAGLFAENIV